MTHIDDISVGDWVAVTAWSHLDDEPVSHPMLPGVMLRKPLPEPDGQPLEIKAISLPFMAVSPGGKTFSLDTRCCKLQRLQPGYVEAIQQARGIPAAQQSESCPIPSMLRCIVCGEQVRFQKHAPDTWRADCEKCESRWEFSMRKVL